MDNYLFSNSAKKRTDDSKTLNSNYNNNISNNLIKKNNYLNNYNNINQSAKSNASEITKSKENKSIKFKDTNNQEEVKNYDIAYHSLIYNEEDMEENFKQIELLGTFCDIDNLNRLNKEVNFNKANTNSIKDKYSNVNQLENESKFVNTYNQINDISNNNLNNLNLEQQNNIDDLISNKFETPFYKLPYSKNFIIYPGSKLKVTMDIVISFLSLYSLIVIPLEYSFFIRLRLNNQNIYIYDYLDFLINIIYFANMLLVFRVALLVENPSRFCIENRLKLVINKRIIAYNYIKSFNFYINLIIIFPLDYFFINNTIKSNFLRVFIYIPKILRIFKLKFLINYFDTILLRIVKLFLLYYMFIHYFACIIYTFENTDNINEVLTSTIDIHDDYLEYVLKSILLLSGNNIRPNDLNTRFLYVFVIFLGILCESILFGTLALLFTKFNPLDKIKNSKISEVNSLCKDLNISSRLKNEIITYYENLWQRKRVNFIDSKIFNEDSEGILNQCLRLRYKMTIAKEEFFQYNYFFENNSFSYKFILDLIKVIDSFITGDVNEIIIFEGDTCDFDNNKNNDDIINNNRFFISTKGSKFTIKTNGFVVNHFGKQNNINEQNKDEDKALCNSYESQIFGEIAFFLKNKRRTATVYCNNISMIYFVNGNDFIKLLYDYPFEAIEIMYVAVERYYSSIELMDFDLIREIRNVKEIDCRIKNRRNSSNKESNKESNKLKSNIFNKSRVEEQQDDTDLNDDKIWNNDMLKIVQRYNKNNVVDISDSDNDINYNSSSISDSDSDNSEEAVKYNNIRKKSSSSSKKINHLIDLYNFDDINNKSFDEFNDMFKTKVK